MSPQPHSSYYSGLTGPQHPFYNRVRAPRSGSSSLLTDAVVLKLRFSINVYS